MGVHIACVLADQQDLLRWKGQIAYGVCLVRKQKNKGAILWLQGIQKRKICLMKLMTLSIQMRMNIRDF